MARTKPTVRGVDAPAPRLTGHGAIAIAQWLGVPLVVSALVLDVIAWLVITWMLEHCYGVLCVVSAL